MDFYEEFLKLKKDQSFSVEMVNYMRNCKTLYSTNMNLLIFISDYHTIIQYNTLGSVHQSGFKYKNVYYIVPTIEIIESYNNKTYMKLEADKSFLKKRKKIYKTTYKRSFNIMIKFDGYATINSDIYIKKIERNLKLKELLNTI